MDTAPVRFAEGTTDTLEGLLVPFGGSFSGKDSYGTFATRDTDFCLNWFETRPLMYSHGLDPNIRTVPVGKIPHVEIRKDGLWMQAQIDQRHEYFDEIRDLVDQGKLGLSSGSVGHLIDIDARTGEWKRWPLIEGSLTPTPSNLLATVGWDDARSHFRSAGIDLNIPEKLADELDDPGHEIDWQHALTWTPETREAHVAPTLIEPTVPEETRAAATDTVDTEKSFEDIRSDINAMIAMPASPFDMSDTDDYSCVIGTYPDYVIVCRMEDGDCSYWRIAYTLDDNAEPVLGESQEMESVFVPARAASLGPLTLDAHALIRSAAALTRRSQELGLRRADDGRTLSPSNRRALEQTASELAETATALRTLVTEADALARDAARVATFADPEYRALRIARLELEAYAASL